MLRHPLPCIKCIGRNGVGRRNKKQYEYILMVSALDIEKIILKALEKHEKSLAQRERQLEEYTNLKSEQMIKTVERLYRFERKLKLRAIELFSHVPNAKAPVLKDYMDDWDWYSTYHALVSDDYISPPTSLELTYEEYALCNYSPTLSIPDGRIVTYMKWNRSWGNAYFYHVDFLMRNQSALGSVEPNTGYRFALESNNYAYTLYRDGSQVASQGGIITPPYDVQSWTQLRITWFSSENGFETHFEYYNGTEWVLIVSLIDVDDTYKGSETNRCGIGCRLTAAGVWVHIDDTEIWSV